MLYVLTADTGGVTTTAGVDDTSTLSGDSDPNESATDFTDTSDSESSFIASEVHSVFIYRGSHSLLRNYV